MKKTITLLITIILLSYPLYSEMIDGPAAVFDSIKGRNAGLLNDGAHVTVIDRTGGWVKFSLLIKETDLNQFSTGNNTTRKITRKHTLTSPILGEAGYISPGIQLNILKTSNPNVYKITLYTVSGNLKDRVEYYKTYTHRFTGINTVSFQFSERITNRVGEMVLNEFGRDGRNPQLDRFRENEEAERNQHLRAVFTNAGIIPNQGIVEVGYYRGKPSVVHRIFISGPPNNDPKVDLDRFYINEKGVLKDYAIGGYQLKTGKYVYYKNSAFTAYQTEVDIYAPGAAKWSFSISVYNGNERHIALFSADFTGFDKKVRALVLKRFRGNQESFSKTIVTQNAQEAISAFLNNAFSKKMNLSGAGITFTSLEPLIRSMDRR